jgi:2'-5' RNA ligase
MRLFVAVDLPEHARALVAAEQHRLAAQGGRAVRFVRPEQLHVTLAFMGSVEADRVDAIRTAVARGFELAPFALVLGGLGVLPDARRPRVLYLGFEHGTEQVMALERLVAARVAECGIGLERRPFRPHLTLARWREPDADGARALLASATHKTVAEQDVERVTLYESRLSSSGAAHTAIATGGLARSRRL